jgi:cell division GTPase FtsZ
MTAKNYTEETSSSTVADDVSNETVPAPALDTDKLAALKAKLASTQKETQMAAKIVEKKTRSLSLGIVGSGQAGGRLAEAFNRKGYDAVAVNTASQDLKFLDLPESNKLVLEGTLGGAAKELEIGRATAEANRDRIALLVQEQLGSCQVHVLTLSLGGGSGAGSCEVMVDILSETGKPLVVMTVLPMDSDDSQTKHNALETLSKLARMAQTKKIHNLIVVDNAKLEVIYSNVSSMDFFNVANNAIVETLDVFNTLSSMPSNVKPLDPAEFGKILLDGEGLTVYGEITVSNYQEDTAIAEAIISSLNSNLLSGGFDLKQSRYVGFILAGNKDVWAKIPNGSVGYAASMIQDNAGSPKGIFRGVYTVDMPENVLKVYTMFSGLGLPATRIDQLKSEAKAHVDNTKGKDAARNLTLNLSTGTDETVSAAQKIKDKIATKNSAFGKLMGGVVDKRK